MMHTLRLIRVVRRNRQLRWGRANTITITRIWRWTPFKLMILSSNILVFRLFDRQSAKWRGRWVLLINLRHLGPLLTFNPDLSPKSESSDEVMLKEIRETAFLLLWSYFKLPLHLEIGHKIRWASFISYFLSSNFRHNRSI